MKLRLGGARARIYLIAAGVIVLALALFLSAPDFLHQVENRLYDLHFKLRGQQDVGDRVVIVAIDESSLAALGRWPWPRSRMAELTRVLSAGGAQVIAFDILFSEPEASGELRAATQISERMRTIGGVAPVGASGSSTISSARPTTIASWPRPSGRVGVSCSRSSSRSVRIGPAPRPSRRAPPSSRRW